MKLEIYIAEEKIAFAKTVISTYLEKAEVDHHVQDLEFVRKNSNRDDIHTLFRIDEKTSIHFKLTFLSNVEKPELSKTEYSKKDGEVLFHSEYCEVYVDIHDFGFKELSNESDVGLYIWQALYLELRDRTKAVNHLDW